MYKKYVVVEGNAYSRGVQIGKELKNQIIKTRPNIIEIKKILIIENGEIWQNVISQLWRSGPQKLWRK